MKKSKSGEKPSKINPPPPPKPEKPEKSTEKVKAKRGESRLKKWITAVRNKLLLVLISVVVVFAAVAAGAFVTYEVQRSVWEVRLEQEDQQQLVDKRIELMERTITVMSRSKVVKDMDEDYRKTTLTSLAKVGLDPSKIVDVVSKTLKEKSLSRCEAMESRTEYVTILRLDAILFGEKTRKAVDALLSEDPWWAADSTLREALIDAMEADFFSESIPE